jgi:Ca-activated chloride channel family protein
MPTFSRRVLANLVTPKLSIPIFGATAVITAGIVLNPLIARQIAPNPHGPLPPIVNQVQNGVTLSGKLAQTKIVQGGLNEVYLTLYVKSPSIEQEAATPPKGTDLVVVLDRSGSMSDPKKLPYAKSAVKQLMDRLGDNDRFALVSFDNHAKTSIPLAPLSGDTRAHINRTVDHLTPGGGTNIHDGVAQAWDILKDNPSARIRKVILLSDGEATSGDTSAAGLRQIASQARQREGMLSTIGMGLRFNETVISAMADHGMGNFTYLESLESLGTILAKDLQDTQHTFAASSELNIVLPPGVELVDAAGYPIQKEGQTVSIATGRLRADATKQFTLTLKVPNARLGEHQFQGVSLSYQREGNTNQVALAEGALTIAVLPEEKRGEVAASIEHASYSSVWQDNNIGRMRNKLNDFIRRGDKAQAKAALNTYREQVQAVEAETGVALYDNIAPELDAMDSSLDDAFMGSAAEQKVKQNRFAKKSHAESLKRQRKQSQ